MVQDQKMLLSVRDLTTLFPIRQTIFEKVQRKPQKYIRAVSGVSLDIRKGETVGLVGESGCGKSSLAKTLIRLNDPASGIIDFAGIGDLANARRKDLRKMHRKIQMVFQDPYSSLNPRMTIRSMFYEILSVYDLCDRTEYEQKTKEILHMVGMPDDILDAVLKVKKRYEDRAVQGGYRENRENDGSLLERTVRQVIAERRKAKEKSGNNERLKREVREALEYIAGHLGDRELLLSKVAAHVGMSKTYFSRLFKESMGETFVNYVTGLRMECARRLYLETDMKVYEIAELVGYSDWHYFYSLYRKTFGHSLSREKNH